MPATLRPADMPLIAGLLQELYALDTAPDPSKFTADEIALVIKTRRDRIVKRLQDKGIEVRADLVDRGAPVELAGVVSETNEGEQS